MALTTLLIGLASLFVSMTASFAAPAPSPATARVAAADLAKTAEAEEPATTGSAKANPEEDEAGCYRARRKLWVDGEGWIVRRVTLCR